MQFEAQQQAAQRNLSYLLAEKLGQQILAGEYQAGSILPGEMELGEKFGVSRTAVREAIKMLAAKGMLLPRPRIGTRVMPQSQWNFLDQDLLNWWMTEENAEQVVQHFLILRTSLEPQACSLAAAKATPQQKAQLTVLMAEMQALHIDFNRERWIEVDTQYHQVIYEASANPFMTSFAKLLSSVYQRYFRTITNNEAIKVQQHQAIVDAIVTGNSAKAFIACQALLQVG